MCCLPELAGNIGLDALRTHDHLLDLRQLPNEEWQNKVCFMQTESGRNLSYALVGVQILKE